MTTILNQAIAASQHSDRAFTKFITANDTGVTGGKQAGFYLHKNAWQIFFDSPG